MKASPARPIRSRLATLLSVLPLLGLMVGVAVAGPTRVEKSGVAIDFSIHNLEADGDAERPRAGDDLLVRFRISDPKTGFPISELHPAAWVSPREPGKQALDLEACKTKIGTLAQLGITHADEDLNSYHILTLNADNTIAVINPVVNLNTSNLRSLITLSGKAGSWDFDERTALAFVTLPAEGKVAVIDIIGGAVKAYLPVGRQPQRVRVQPDGRFVWVGNDGSGTVSIIEADGSAVVKTLEVGVGPVDFSFDRRGRFAFVTAEGAGTLSVIDVARFEVARSLPIEQGSASSTYSRLSDAVYVLNGATHQLTVVHPESGRVLKRLSVPEAARTIRATPDGRFLLALAPAEKSVIVLDTASNSLLRVIPLQESPTHILFSEIFAYVYHAGAANMTLIQLSGLDDLSLPPTISIPLGLAKAGAALGTQQFLPMALLPEQGGVVAANPAEKVIYFYTDGMSAPMGSFKTFTATPLGMILYDRSLQERRSAGVYSSNIRLDQPGVYDVPFVLPSPSVVTCFEITIESNGEVELARLPPVFKDRFHQQVFSPGESSRLRFELRDARSGEPISEIADVRLMAFRLGRNWSTRRYAESLGEGLYEAEIVFPGSGEYNVLVEAPSLGVHFGDIRHVEATVSKRAVK